MVKELFLKQPLYHHVHLCEIWNDFFFDDVLRRRFDVGFSTAVRLRDSDTSSNEIKSCTICSSNGLAAAFFGTACGLRRRFVVEACIVVEGRWACCGGGR